MRREWKKELYAKTRVFASRKDCKVYRKSIDWMTIRLSENSEIVKILDRHDMYTDEKTSRMPILWGIFYIQYFDMVMNGLLKVYHIKDSENNKQVGCIHIRQESEKKTKNVFTDIELVWHFWTCYTYTFERILKFFNIQKTSRNIVSRIDYAIDFDGPEVKDFTRYERESKKRESAQNAMTLLADFKFSQDGEFLMIPKSEMEKIKEIMDTTKVKRANYGERDTYKGIQNERNELYIYDKKLDILDKEKYKLHITDRETGEIEYPYLEVMKESKNITRIEYKKKARSLREMVENSINEVLEKIEDMAIDYMEDYYDLDFRYLVGRERTKIVKSQEMKEKAYVDQCMKGIIKKKSSLSLAMFRSYAEKYIMFKNEKDFFGQLYSIFWERLVDNIIKHHIDFPVNHAFDFASFTYKVRQKNLKLSSVIL